MVLCDEVAYHEFEGVALKLDERERLIRDIGDKKLLMLRNHGTIAVGETVSTCFLRLYNFERAYTMQVRALASGNLHQPSPEAIATTREQGRLLLASGELDRLAWPALLRMLDSRDASFRD